MRSPLLRKRRVSVTRMGVKPSYPSNHGTHPKATPNRSFARSFPSTMATAAAPPPPPTANQQRFRPTQPSKSSPKANLSVPKTSTIQTPIRDVVDLDEGWILELQAARQEEYKLKADSLYKDLLAALEKAGPFIDPARANALQAAYQQELEKIRESQQKEVDNVIEMERQARLWSLGAEDPEWAGWGDLREEQICILQNIQKESGWTDDDASEVETDEDSVQKQVNEAAQEYEQTSRSFAEWQRTEPQRMQGRALWRETWMESQESMKERRQRDLSDFEARAKARQDLYDRAEQIASEARLGSAPYRGNPSLATLFANGESFATWRPSASSLSDTPSRSSFTESQLSDTPNTTPASSVYINPSFPSPPRHSSARPVPIPSPEERNRSSSGSSFYNVEDRQRTPYGSFSASNTSRMHGAGHTPSPTPTSHMPNASSIPSSSSAAAHSRSGMGETLPERWIPPDLAQHLPQKKASMSFEKSRDTGPTRMKSALFGESPAPPHPPIPEERPSSSASEAPPQRPINNYHTQNPSSTSATTSDHHPSSAAPRSSSYSYTFPSASASASATVTAASGILSATASVPLSSTSASTSTNRVPSAPYQAPPAPGMRSKPLPQHPPASSSTTTNSTSSTSSSSTTAKPAFPSTHLPNQRQHTFPSYPSQPSPTEPKVFQPQPQQSRSFSASSSSSFSGSIPSFATRTSSISSASAATPAAVPPISPIDESHTSRASSAASASFASQAANQAKTTTSAMHSAGHATQTPLNKTTFSQAQPPQTQPPQTQAAPQSGYPSNDEARTKLRQQYVADEERRAEEERLRREDEERRKREQEEEEFRRKEQEANERRAEEAKKRGEERRKEEERRRQEEMARDAERREHERKARKAQAAAAGMSGSYPGSGFGSMPNVSGMYGMPGSGTGSAYGMPGSTSGAYGGPTGSTSSGMPGAGNTSSSSSYSSAAAAHATSSSTPPPTSTTSAAELWEMYEKQWVAMAQTSQTSHLRFRSIPWPVMIQITSPEQLLPIRIAQFIFHPMHSQGKSKEKRIREALLKWHPDRFNSKWLHKIAPDELDKVVDGAGRVVRALNELLNGVNSNGFGE